MVGLTLGANGIARGMPRPRIMESDADLVSLRQLAQFHPQLITHVPAMLIKAFGDEKAEVFMIKLWNGAPFYRDPDGQLFLQMHVGVPPQHSGSGTAVFTYAGEYVEGGR